MYQTLYQNKTPIELTIGVIGGPVQVRTGVAAFAELSLTTRPQDHLVDGFYYFNENPRAGSKNKIFLAT